MRILLVALLNIIVVSTNASPADLWRAVLDPEVLYEVSDNIPTLATKLNLTTLVEYVTKAGLAGPLSGKGPFTVFGPNNAAFDNLPKALKDMLMKNTTLLSEVLKYHVISGSVYSGAITNELIAPTLLPGADIRLNIYGKTVTASGRKVIKVDQNATNGVIHILDSVMLPPAGTVTQLVGETPKLFSTLLNTLVATNLANTLNGPGPFTVFAPTNQAFANLPAGALADLLKNPKKLAGEDCYCLAPVNAKVVEVSGTVTTNSSIWTTYQDTNYCSKKGYKIFPDQGYCLKFFSTGEPWDIADSRCQEDGGHLVTVNTQQDLTNLRSLYSQSTYVYVGAHRTLTGTEFVWITGGTVKESLWNPDEPNDASGVEDCGELIENEKLIDNSCNEFRSFICQILIH